MRVLMITPVPPYPPIAGGRQRTQLLFRALQQCADVELFLLGDLQEMPEAHREVLRNQFNLVGSVSPRRRGEYGFWRLFRGFAPRLVDRLAHNIGRRSIDYRPDARVAREIARLDSSGRYDLVVGRYLIHTVKSGAFELGLPVVVDVDDLEVQVYTDRIASPETSAWERVVLANHLRRLKKIVPEWLGRASHLWFSCDLDSRQFAHASASTLPNVPFLGQEAQFIAAPSPDQEDGRVLVVGSFNHPPNAKGVDWFLSEVWPIILDSGIPANLHVVGGGLDQTVAARWRSIRNVTVTGYVEDLMSQYRKASVVVAPVFEGGGTKIKVIESLHYQCATVVTPHALRGYSHLLKHEEALLVADGSQKFAAAVMRFLRDKDLRDRLGRAGRRVVAVHLSADRFTDVVRQTLNKVGVLGSHGLEAAAASPSRVNPVSVETPENAGC